MFSYSSSAGVLGLALWLAACGDEATVPGALGYGEHPVLPNPKTSLLPTINMAKAVGWAAGEQPTPAAGLAVQAFATGLQHPRWLAFLPNGDVLVAETDAPEKPDDSRAFGDLCRNG
jgi:glucose/arabinose dehydrogenase